MISKKIIFPAVAVFVVGGAAVLGASANQVYAQSNANPFSSLVTTISQKFNLDQTQVQSVFDQFISQRKQNMQQNMQQKEVTRLNNLVTQGKITSAQKDAILAELTKLKSEYSMDSLKGKTPAQRKQSFTDEQTEIKNWAQSQGIDPTYVMPFEKGVMRRGGWFKGKPSPSPTT